MRRRSVVFLVCSVLWVSVAGAQSPYPDRPIDVRVTGVLVPPEEQTREDLAVVHVFVQGNPMLLRVGKVEELTPQERAQVIKYEVLLQKVRFSGPESLMGYLQKPETRGKVLTIEGWLDPREKRFQVTTVKEAAEAMPSTP
ncbi:MAG: hypothetical protein AB1671_21805 [Thermodesulfobacteriota bacterium]|jgi:hypothetical protein